MSLFVKSVIKNVSGLQLAWIGIVGMLVGGCTGGGGSGDEDARNSDPVIINAVRIGSPLCSTSGNGSVSGPFIIGTSGTVTMTSSCSAPSATMRVWLAVRSADTNITHYDWEIVGWQDQAPHGGLEKYDEIRDIDPVNGRYIVRKHGVNSIRYASASSAQLASLTQPFTQYITVTAWTPEGRYGTASFAVTITPGGAAVASVYGSLEAEAPYSAGRAGHYADFYEVTGSGSTTFTAEGFDTYLYLYDDALKVVVEADEGSPNGGSKVSANLQSGRTYYLEITSYKLGATGNYRLTSTSGRLIATQKPWPDSSGVAKINGSYNVSENTTVTIIYQGITTTTNASTVRSTTITQVGHSFRFLATDSTGSAPSITRYGNIKENSLILSGEPFLPLNPDFNVTSNTQTSSGTIGNNQLSVNTISELKGSYNGLPLTARVNSSATFTRR